jgi:murein DD-endopeptidase MepM/ murein hydrolase activator NlpD
MKKMTSRRASHILRKNKKGITKRNFFRKIIRLLVWLIIILTIIYTTYKYNLLPNRFNFAIDSLGPTIKNFVPSQLRDSNDTKDKSEKNEKNEINDTKLDISNNDFEYKFWALSYFDSSNNELTGAENTAGIGDSSNNKEAEMNTVENNSETKNDDEKKITSDIGNKYVFPAQGKIGSVFGNRVHPIKGSTEPHKGIDFEAGMGEPIKAFYKGQVTFCGFEKTFGNHIKISHDNGMVSLYAHSSKIIVKKGQKVATGEIIAYVGDTGLALGPHLHFEIHKNNIAVDPMIELKKIK